MDSINYTRRTSIIFTVTGILVLLSGLLAIAGWFFNISTFTSIFPDYVTMKFNTALCFVLIGMAFLLLIKGKGVFSKTLYNLLIILLGILALLSLSQYFFNWSAGIDQLFVTDSVSIAKHLPYPGRMSPTSALCFTILALSFGLIGSSNRNYHRLAQYLFHIVTFISFISVIGFLYQVRYSVQYSFFSSMAVNTAANFLLLSIVASNINNQLGINRVFSGNTIGSIIARKLFLRMLGLLVIAGYISIRLQHLNYISTEFGVIISIATFLVIGLFLIWDTLTEMNLIDQKRTDAQQETAQLNINLEKLIWQRTTELEYSNDMFLKIFNANPIGMIMTNLESGIYVDVNPCILNQFGYTRDEIIGQTATGLGFITAEYREYIADNILKKGYLRDADIVLKTKDGEIRHCILSVELLETVKGRFLMSFIYDITKRKIIEDTLQETKNSLQVLTDKLTNQNKQLLSFAHIISHNLRSPVSNLNLLLHFYKESTTIEDKEDLWKNFETVVGHLNTSLDDLLETLKIQEDIDKERENLSFEHIFEMIKDVLIGQIIQSGAIITADFSKAGHIVYPKIYLESIMLNLLSNAIKYRSPNRVPSISISTVNINGETILTVQDNGLGIDMNRHRKNLFGMRKTFHRHAEAKGLGLFITKTQIEAMGGEIHAESEVNVGTVFKVIFDKKTI